MNALANEALPLFLDKLVPAYVAVIMSVTLVLFCGEIIPSAIFTGPQQLAVSSKLAPLVKFVLFILAPIAVPIAKILDYVLHHSDESMEKYDRGELGALVRLQFEDRISTKAKRKQAKASLKASLEPIGSNCDVCNGSDFISPNVGPAQSQEAETTRFVKHIDEVTMVEGALNMHTKTVVDVMVPWKRVYTIPHDMILDEANIVDIYRCGHSRIPVYMNYNNAYDGDSDDGISYSDGDDKNGDSNDGNSNRLITGLFKTKQLAVIDSHDNRALSTLHLSKPIIVNPKTNMVDLLNMLQDGKGQMAIVCLYPDDAIEALNNEQAIPKSAEIIGIVTLEDCLEELIQEEIYDEFDRTEQVAYQRAKRAVRKWKSFVRRKKEAKAAAAAAANNNDEAVDENTSLLPIV